MIFRQRTGIGLDSGLDKAGKIESALQQMDEALPCIGRENARRPPSDIDSTQRQRSFPKMNKALRLARHSRQPRLDGSIVGRATVKRAISAFGQTQRNMHIKRKARPPQQRAGPTHFHQLPPQAKRGGYAPPSSIWRKARKASWGIDTRPICFMRFLPSFCFSSSLRLRVMSPP